MGRLVGYGVSQVPTNGMLGGMAYQDPTNVSVNILRVGPSGGNFQPGNGTNASLAVSGIFTGSYTPSGPLLSLYAKATVLGISNDAGVTENNSALIGFSCLNNSGFNSQAYFGAVSSPESGGDFGRGAVLVWGRRSGNNYAESMRVSRTGDVGIGSTQISTKLDVVQSTGGTDTLKLENSSSNNVIRLQSASTFDNYIDFYSGASSGALIFRRGGTESARFNSTGAFVLAGGTTTANGIGIAFPATQSASTDPNTLDDYEEGTWTPQLSFGGATTGIVQNIYTSGHYTKVGRLVVVRCTIELTNKGTATGAAAVTGLPFTSSVESYGSFRIYNTITWTSGAQLTFQITGATVFIYSTASGAFIADLTNTNFANNSAFNFTMSYFV